MIALHLVVDGPSEEWFVRLLLAPHLRDRGVTADAVIVPHVGYRRHKRQGICGLLRENVGDTHRFSTMFDYYALPEDFPGKAGPAGARPLDRVSQLEDALAEDIADPRFIPYLQLHEFEALLLADPSRFVAQYPDRPDAVQGLVASVASAGEPEDIDDGPETAPSKRIAAHFPRYAQQKPLASSTIARAIGLETMRARCPHFATWLRALEALPVAGTKTVPFQPA